MAATVSEQFESRIVTTGVNARAELRYHIHGTNDEREARLALIAARPLTYDIYNDATCVLIADSITTSPVGDELWEGTVTYSEYAYQPEFTFETGGGTQHIVNALFGTRVYMPPNTPDISTDHNLIGVTPDSAEPVGIDIAVPVYNFSETHFLTDGSMTEAYKLTVRNLTGSVNASPFRGHQAGEVLFMGAGGMKRGSDSWQVTYRFAASPNAIASLNEDDEWTGGLTIGNVAHITKYGWEYLDLVTAPTEDNGGKRIGMKVVAVKIHGVYPAGNFSLLGIGT